MRNGKAIKQLGATEMSLMALNHKKNHKLLILTIFTALASAIKAPDTGTAGNNKTPPITKLYTKGIVQFKAFWVYLTL
jgi:hypothetical protein